MATHKPFRELVKPGSNFEFVGRTKIWMFISFVLVSGSIAMLFVNNATRGDHLNWTIDFKGGTELIFEFCDTNGDHVEAVDAAKVRESLKSAGFAGFEVSDFTWKGTRKCPAEGSSTIGKKRVDVETPVAPPPGGGEADAPPAAGTGDEATTGDADAPAPGEGDEAATDEPAAPAEGDEAKAPATGAPPDNNNDQIPADKADPAAGETKAPEAEAASSPGEPEAPADEPAPPPEAEPTSPAAAGATSAPPPAPGDKPAPIPEAPGSGGGDNEYDVHGLLIRTPDFGALDTKQQKMLQGTFVKAMTDACLADPTAKAEGRDESVCTPMSASWSGDRLFVRSTKPLDEAVVRDFFHQNQLEVKPGGQGFEAVKAQGFEEVSTEITIYGLDRQYQSALSEGLGGIEPRIVQTNGVGAKAGAQLRNDGIKSLFYAMALIVLYLAFRFDIRYAPGAVIALMHDAVLVVGVFAITWTEVSLTSVAALLTVIGYSVNDTVVIFDRIRENVGRLKDKKLDRIVNISLNETLQRTLLTSITLFVVTIMMNIFGAGLVRNFAFAMNIGVVVGVYSSVFIASPVLLYLDRRFYPPRGPTKGEGARGKAVAKSSGGSSASGKGSAAQKSKRRKKKSPAPDME